MQPSFPCKAAMLSWEQKITGDGPHSHTEWALRWVCEERRQVSNPARLQNHLNVHLYLCRVNDGQCWQHHDASCLPASLLFTQALCVDEGTPWHPESHTGGTQSFGRIGTVTNAG